MDQHVRTLTRRELYDLVWAQPMRKLASQFGLSDVGLAKTCRRHEVPVPGLGYWAKHAVGKAPKRPALKPVDDPRLDTISLKELRIATDDDYPPEVRAELERHRGAVSEERKLSVLREHPLVRQTRLWKPPVRPNRHTDASPPTPSQIRLDISVSPELRSRAMSALNAVLHAVERRGWTVGVECGDEMHGVVIKVLGERFSIRAVEPARQVAHVATKEELAAEKRYGYRVAPRFDHFESGELAIELAEWVRWCPGRKRWRDSKSTVVESKIPDMMLGLLLWAAERRERDARMRRSEEARLAAEQVLRERERRDRIEREKIADLIGQAERWAKSRLLLEYLGAVRAALIERDGSIDPLGEHAAWLAWGESVARSAEALGRSQVRP